MRIAYCYPEILPAQTARAVQVINTCLYLAGQVSSLILYLPQGSHGSTDIFNYYGLTRPPNLQVCFVRKSLGPISSHKIYNFSLERALKNSKPDIFFTRHLQTAAFLADMPVPFIFEAHEIFAEKKKSSAVDLQLEKKVFSRADGVIFISKGLQEALEKQYAFRGIRTVIPSSAKRIDTLSRKSFVKGELSSFVYVGTTRYGWKGVDVLIKALELMPTHYSLEIIGQLDRKFAAQARVKKLINQKRLISRGYVKPAEIFSFMTKAQVAVIPNSGKDRISACFTSPLKLIEALAAGVAVVVSDLPSMREIVTDKEALFVRPDEPASLADGILTLLRDEPLRKELAQNGWQRSSQYTWEKRAEKIVKLAEKIIDA